jgi:hypothetical protein
LGLGLTSLSYVQSTVNAAWGANLLVNIFAQNPSEPNFIAVTLQRTSDPADTVEGTLSIGKYNCQSRLFHILTVYYRRGRSPVQLGLVNTENPYFPRGKCVVSMRFRYPHVIFTLGEPNALVRPHGLVQHHQRDPKCYEHHRWSSGRKICDIDGFWNILYLRT